MSPPILEILRVGGQSSTWLEGISAIPRPNFRDYSKRGGNGCWRAARAVFARWGGVRHFAGFGNPCWACLTNSGEVYGTRKGISPKVRGVSTRPSSRHVSTVMKEVGCDLKLNWGCALYRPIDNPLVARHRSEEASPGHRLFPVPAILPNPGTDIFPAFHRPQHFLEASKFEGMLRADSSS